ncbi:uncharacterized protein G2W53_011921 [Senna tora]|uniref:Uncharacterized protein n=1 Tax=Senna tora TaxID=362788 RepID=A0A834TW09_9FABA|nr:uncharacterized protein G2W53_011921 [Senna tora]
MERRREEMRYVAPKCLCTTNTCACVTLTFSLDPSPRSGGMFL